MGRGIKSAVIYGRSGVFARGIGALLRATGVDVVGTSESADEALDLLSAHRPDVFVAGVDASAGDGVAMVRGAAASRPGIRVIVVSDADDAGSVDAAFAAGAAAFVSGSADSFETAVPTVQTFDGSLDVAAPAASSLPETQRDGRRLTTRELEALRLAASGYSNAQLGNLLGVREKTVKFHLSNVYRKLGVANRAQAAHAAHQLGLLADGRPTQDVTLHALTRPVRFVSDDFADGSPTS